MIALGGFLLPFGLGYAAGDLLGMTIEQSLFIGTAGGDVAGDQVTDSRRSRHPRYADRRRAPGRGALSDVGILVVFAGVTGFIESGEVTLLGLGTVMLRALAFFAVALVIGDRVLPVVWERLEGLMRRYGFIDKTSAFSVALIVALIFAYLAALADLHMIIGGFVAGMFLRQAQLNEDFYDHMHTVIYDLAMGVFAPIFFVTVGFELTLGLFTEELGLLLLVLVLAFFGKIVGSWAFALPTKLTSREGLVIGLGMNGRGTVEIIIVSIGLSMGIISQQLFSILVFMAIFTTTLVPVTVKLGVDWLEQANELVYMADDQSVEPEV